MVINYLSKSLPLKPADSFIISCSCSGHSFLDFKIALLIEKQKHISITLKLSDEWNFPLPLQCLIYKTPFSIPPLQFSGDSLKKLYQVSSRKGHILNSFDGLLNVVNHWCRNNGLNVSCAIVFKARKIGWKWQLQMSHLTRLEIPHQEWCLICTVFCICIVNVKWHVRTQFMCHILPMSSDVSSCVVYIQIRKLKFSISLFFQKQFEVHLFWGYCKSVNLEEMFCPMHKSHWSFFQGEKKLILR